MSVKFEIDGVYNFEVYPVSILGQEFRAVKVLMLMNANRAIAEEPVDVLHDNVYGMLPEGSPRNYRDQVFIQILDATGSTRVLGESWIRPESITKLEGIDAEIIVRDISTTDLAILRDVISAAGYSNFDIRTIRSE